jgi:hypothetical protein
MKRLPIPDSAVLALVVASVALVMSTGVRWGVSHKARTAHAGAEFIEDSLAGAAFRGGAVGARWDFGKRARQQRLNDGVQVQAAAAHHSTPAKPLPL